MLLTPDSSAHGASAGDTLRLESLPRPALIGLALLSVETIADNSNLKDPDDPVTQNVLEATEAIGANPERRNGILKHLEAVIKDLGKRESEIDTDEIVEATRTLQELSEKLAKLENEYADTIEIFQELVSQGLLAEEELRQAVLELFSEVDEEEAAEDFHDYVTRSIAQLESSEDYEFIREGLEELRPRLEERSAQIGKIADIIDPLIESKAIAHMESVISKKVFELLGVSPCLATRASRNVTAKLDEKAETATSEELEKLVEEFEILKENANDREEKIGECTEIIETFGQAGELNQAQSEVKIALETATGIKIDSTAGKPTKVTSLAVDAFKTEAEKAIDAELTTMHEALEKIKEEHEARLEKVQSLVDAVDAIANFGCFNRKNSAYQKRLFAALSIKLGRGVPTTLAKRRDHIAALAKSKCLTLSDEEYESASRDILEIHEEIKSRSEHLDKFNDALDRVSARKEHKTPRLPFKDAIFDAVSDIQLVEHTGRLSIASRIRTSLDNQIETIDIKKLEDAASKLASVADRLTNTYEVLAILLNLGDQAETKALLKSMPSKLIAHIFAIDDEKLDSLKQGLTQIAEGKPVVPPKSGGAGKGASGGRGNGKGAEPPVQKHTDHYHRAMRAIMILINKGDLGDLDSPLRKDLFPLIPGANMAVTEAVIEKQLRRCVGEASPTEQEKIADKAEELAEPFDTGEEEDGPEGSNGAEPENDAETGFIVGVDDLKTSPDSGRIRAALSNGRMFGKVGYQEVMGASVPELQVTNEKFGHLLHMPCPILGEDSERQIKDTHVMTLVVPDIGRDPFNVNTILSDFDLTLDNGSSEAWFEDEAFANDIELKKAFWALVPTVPVPLNFRSSSNMKHYEIAPARTILITAAFMIKQGRLPFGGHSVVTATQTSDQDVVTIGVDKESKSIAISSVKPDLRLAESMENKLGLQLKYDI